MENIFNFAKKELSQDAILCWIFANYSCENASVKATCRALFNSFTDNKLNYDSVTDMKVVTQWKNIDIALWFRIDGEDYLVVIEDKVGSQEHNQLKIYNDAINGHNNWWKHNKDACTETYVREDIRFAKDDDHIFKIFYKTDIIDEEEKRRVEAQNWKIYSIYDIYPLLQDIQPTSELLGSYMEHVRKTWNDAMRTSLPSEWNILAWHSLFNEYTHKIDISQHKEINTFQGAYYYTKFFVKGHENDMPCFEIRSRDFVFDGNRFSMKILAVLYNYEGEATKEQIDAWQTALSSAGFSLNHRKNMKQIAWLEIGDIENSEAGIRTALDRASELLVNTFG